jgi:hypothetical protein
MNNEKAGVCSIHREPHLSGVSLIPGAGASNNMSSTFGKDVLRQLGFTEKEFETISILSKLIGPVASGQVIDLDVIQKGLEGRLMKLKQLRAEGKTHLYMDAIASHQKASQPFLYFKNSMIQLRAHVLSSAGIYLQDIRKLLVEFEKESDKSDPHAINALVNRWKDSQSMSDLETTSLINFVYSPLERNPLFSKEKAIEGIAKSKRDVYFLPTLTGLSPTFHEELKLAHWIVGAESSILDSEIMVQFFLYINRESAEECSKSTTFALAVRQVGRYLRDYIKVLHLKLALAKAFQLNPEDDNWTPAIDQLLEKFDAIAILAEALGLEYSLEYESFVGNFDVLSVKPGLYSTVNTIYSSTENLEHWWPLHWLGVKDGEDLKAKSKMVRETIMTMPAREIRYRLEKLLKRQSERMALDTALTDEWIDVDNWV